MTLYSDEYGTHSPCLGPMTPYKKFKTLTNNGEFFIIFSFRNNVSYENGTNNMGNQQKFERALASQQSDQNIRCSHTESIGVDPGSCQKIAI